MLHCFAMKMYSKRRKRKLEIIQEDLKMRLVYKFYIRHTDELDRLFRISNNLYNQALYLFRQRLDAGGIWTWYNDMDKPIKDKFVWYSPGFSLVLASASFPEIKWSDDEPTKVSITIKK